MQAVKNMGAGMIERHGARPGRNQDQPAFTIRASAGGTEPGGFRWQPEEGDDVLYRNGSGKNAALRPSDKPAPTIMFGQRSNKVDWVREEGDDVSDRPEWVKNRPATTVVGTRRSSEGMLVGRQLADGSRQDIGGHSGEAGLASGQLEAIRVTPEEAATLQTYPTNFKFEGAKGKRFLQIGNAVPPLLAQVVLVALWAKPVVDNVLDFPAPITELEQAA